MDDCKIGMIILAIITMALLAIAGGAYLGWAGTAAENTSLQYEVNSLKSQLYYMEDNYTDMQNRLTTLQIQLQEVNSDYGECQAQLEKEKEKSKFYLDYMNVLVPAMIDMKVISNAYNIYSIGEYDYISCERVEDFYNDWINDLESYKDFVRSNCDKLKEYLSFTDHLCNSEISAANDLEDYADTLKNFCDQRS